MAMVVSLRVWTFQMPPKNNRPKEKNIFLRRSQKIMMQFHDASSSIQTALSVLNHTQFMPMKARGLYRRSGISPP